MDCKHCLKQIIDSGIYDALFGRQGPKTDCRCVSAFDGEAVPGVCNSLHLSKDGQALAGSSENRDNKRQISVEDAPFAAKLHAFESLKNTRGYHQADVCMPSNLSSFQKEKLERICKSKVYGQLGSAADAFANYGARKNPRTGEYEISTHGIRQAIKEAGSVLKSSKPSNIAHLIRQFEENCSGKDNKGREGQSTREKSTKFKDILSKFSQLNGN